MAYFLGIDISTTATKALLIDAMGRVVDSVSSEYAFETPKPLWCEQSPELWWIGAVESIQGLIAKTGIAGDEIRCIGLTGQMHGMVLLDGSGKVLRPAILWNDQRTSVECDQIRALIGKQRLIEITGNDALTGFTAPKIVWVRNNEPELYSRIAQILLPKDYVRFRLTETYATDRAGGSGTILFDLRERTWSPEILNALDIDLAWLPPAFEGPEITGSISPAAAQATGLKAGTPVVAGGGDQAAQALGVGAVHAGVVALTLGTSGVVFASADAPLIEPQGRLHAFCHALPHTWHMMGVMLSAAGSLRWQRDTFAPHAPFDEFVDQAAAVSPGSEGLLFLPYLTGERTPHPDPQARGAFVGLTVRHTLPHLTRAVLEGVAFGLRDSFELLRSAGLHKITQVRISGGGSRSPLWRQIIADVLNVELVTTNASEGAAYGAAILAAIGAGQFEQQPDAWMGYIQPTGVTLPGEDVDRYSAYYARYRELYPALQPTFAALTGLDLRKG
jgi:xylulokinase